MKQEIIIRRSDHTVDSEDNTETKFKFDYHRTRFSEHESFKEYLHLQVGDYSDFHLYFELNKYQMQDVIKLLQEKVDSMY